MVLVSLPKGTNPLLGQAHVSYPVKQAMMFEPPELASPDLPHPSPTEIGTLPGGGGEAGLFEFHRIPKSPWNIPHRGFSMGIPPIVGWFFPWKSRLSPI